MKLKISITVMLLSVSFLSIGQSTINSQFSNTIDNEVLQDKEPKDSLFKEKEWKKIKKQIQKNKKRYDTYKSTMSLSKVIDTVYLNVPSNKKEDSRLSDW